MRLKIAARKSDLARLQAYSVGRALQNKQPNLEVSYFFKESLGDKNLHDPLWQMPERGVFTEDFVDDLRTGKVDLVVHSWKDLPVEDRPGSAIVATLPRADARDLLLFRKDRLPKGKIARLRVLSSSPRRAYNLQNFFSTYLPFQVDEADFVPVRGNIPTRMRKLFSEDADALILAKAALDRLLTAPEAEFLPIQKELRELLEKTLFMVLPISENPPAAAQGALAIEALSSRQDLLELCQLIHCQTTYLAATQERLVLSSYGGGCHQKIGVHFQTHAHGRLLQARGQTTAGIDFQIRDWQANQANSEQKITADKLWPENPTDLFFTREPIKDTHKPETALWAARAEAVPENWQIKPEQIVWTSGLMSWQKLANRGIWVHGSEESLGEERPNINALCDHNIQWTKLTHSEGFAGPEMPLLATYKLKARPEKPDFSQKTHFFWMSASSFSAAIKFDPSILKHHHACGPGNTYTILKQKIPHLRVFLSYKDWHQSLCKT